MNNCKEDIELELDCQKVNGITEAKSINDFFKDFDTTKVDEFMKNLISDYCLCVNCVEYRFCEIELYFSSDKHRDCRVIKRDNKQAGEIFFHTYGFDICFKSCCKNQYGGVLVRSVRSMMEANKNNFILGPKNCLFKVLNHSNSGLTNIKIEIKSSNKNDKFNIYNSKRIIGKKTKCGYDNKTYRYFTEDFHKYVCSLDNSKRYRKLHESICGQDLKCI